MELDHKGVVHCGQDVTLGQGIQDLLSLDDQVLSDYFHCIELVGLGVRYHENLPVGTGP